jgi:hypothetical protein
MKYGNSGRLVNSCELIYTSSIDKRQYCILYLEVALRSACRLPIYNTEPIVAYRYLTYTNEFGNIG